MIEETGEGSWENSGINAADEDDKVDAEKLIKVENDLADGDRAKKLSWSPKELGEMAK